MSEGYQKGRFSFSYPVKEVKKALDLLFETKNDYSWSEYEATMMLGLDLECDTLLRYGEESILLSAAESMSLGLYKKSAKKTNKKVDKKVKK